MFRLFDMYMSEKLGMDDASFQFYRYIITVVIIGLLTMIHIGFLIAALVFMGLCRTISFYDAIDNINERRD